MKYLVMLMLPNLYLRKSKQTEKLKVITVFQCTTLWFIIAKNQVEFGSDMTFFKEFLV
jgi:hypothetical protein